MQIYKPNGEVLYDDIVGDNSYRTMELMGQHNLTVYIELGDKLDENTKAIDFQVGCYTDFQGITYKIRKKSAITKRSSRNLEYTIVFESPQAEGEKRTVRNPVDNKLKFPYNALPREHLQLLVDNLNVIDKDWEIGECIVAERKTIAYNHTKCLEALKSIADAYNTEWEINNKTIHLRKVEYSKDTPLPLAYGKNNGFRTGIKRELSAVPIEILAVQGGERNIDFSTYKNKELLLPKDQCIKYDGVKFEGEPGFNSNEARDYIVDADGLTIRRKGKPLVTYEDASTDLSHIYPRRVGKVTKADPQTPADFYDEENDIDYSKSEYRIDGEKMTVIFQTGMLAGKEFDIKTEGGFGYNHDKQKFMLVPQEYDGQTMPNETFAPRPASGDYPADTYAVFGMKMPNEYIVSASWELFREAVKVLYEEEQDTFTFSGELSPIWTKQNWPNVGGKLIVGGYVRFTDEQMLEADEPSILIRITGIKQGINNPYNPQITLANAKAATYASDFREIQQNEVVAEAQNKETVNFVKRSYRGMMELVDNIYDPSGSFQQDMVSAVALRAMMVALGDPLLQYVFMDENWSKEIESNITYNKEDGKQRLECPEAYIRHMTLGIDTVQPERSESDYLHWYIPSFNSSMLSTNPSQSYYLYLKVSQSHTTNEDNLKVGTGEWFISETKVAFDSKDGSYILLVAFVNSEEDGNRNISNLFGFAEMTPGMLRINNIASIDGQCYLKLLENKFKFGSKDKSIDWNVTEPDTLTLTNAVIRDSLRVDGQADIAGFKFSDEVIKATKQTNIVELGELNGVPSLLIDGINGLIKLYSSYSGGQWSQDQTLGSIISLTSSSGTVETRSNKDNRVAYMSPSGIFCNSAETQAVSATLGVVHKAAIVGLGFGKVNKNDWQNENFIAGVYGRADNSGTAPAYGGFFYNLMASGLFLRMKAATESLVDVYVSEGTSSVIGYSRYQNNVYLPADGVIGRTIFFKQWWTGRMRVYPQGGQKLYDDSTPNDYIDIPEGWGAICHFTIGYIGEDAVKTEAWLISKFKF